MQTLPERGGAYVPCSCFDLDASFDQLERPDRHNSSGPAGCFACSAGGERHGIGYPSDSTETGLVQITAGATTSQGAIQILTRGTAQTSVQVQSAGENWTVVYSQGEASKSDQNASTALSLEAASTSESLYFPLPFLSGILQNPDSALQYVGSEAIGGVSVQHVRTWNTFQSSPLWQFLTPFTVTDIWLDASTSLPRRISFVHRDGGGATPRILNVIDYSNFQSSGGVLYPKQIVHSVNEILWMTVSIQSATFNSSLTNADFPVVQGEN